MLHGSENVNRRRVKIVDRSVLRASSWDGIGIGQPGSPLGRKRTLAQFCSGTDFQSSVINLPPLKEDWTDWKQKSGNKSVSVFDSNKIFINICPHPDIKNPERVPMHLPFSHTFSPPLLKKQEGWGIWSSKILDMVDYMIHIKTHSWGRQIVVSLYWKYFIFTCYQDWQCNSQVKCVLVSHPCHQLTRLACKSWTCQITRERWQFLCHVNEHPARKRCCLNRIRA